jgi:hypothetical protein
VVAGQQEIRTVGLPIFEGINEPSRAVLSAARVVEQGIGSDGEGAEGAEDR